MWGYSQSQCEENAKLENVAAHVSFRAGDAAKLSFVDETFDGAVSNFVFHEVRAQPDKRALILEALRVLDGVEGIAQCFLTEKDVVRHELVQRIVKAYAEYENKKGKGKPAAKPAGKRLPTRRKEGK